MTPKETTIYIKNRDDKFKEERALIEKDIISRTPIKPLDWGGKREGAGRPATGRKKKNYYVTDDEDTKIRELIESLRKGED